MRAVPDMNDIDVLIVGAGPVGLTLAIDLAWRGIDVTVVEARAPGAPPEPKCNHVAARTMEIFRRLGVAERGPIVYNDLLSLDGRSGRSRGRGATPS